MPRPVRASLNGLFRRSTELQCALAVRDAKPSPQEYIDMLSYVKRRLKHPLGPDTMRVLQRPAHTVSCVVHRHLCLELLKSLGPLDTSQLVHTYLESNDLEKAVKSSDLQGTVNPELAQILLDAGGTQELLALIAGGWTPSEEIWQQLFQYLLRDRKYNTAAKLWLHRPKLPVGTLGIPSSTVKDMVALLGKSSVPASIMQELLDNLRDDVSPVTIGALIDRYSCSDLEEALDALRKAGSRIRYRDVPETSKRLGVAPTEALKKLPNSPFTLQGNVILQGIYENYSSLALFHAYRLMVSTTPFCPDIDTAQILANGAYRLGNSKVLAHEIWKELVVDRGITPSRKLCETMLMCQKVGLGFRTSFYFLGEMRRRGIYLRKHIQRMLYNTFTKTDDRAMIDMFNDLKQLDSYAVFDYNLAREETGKHWPQAERNTQVYLGGKGDLTLERLDQMLEFDQNNQIVF